MHMVFLSENECAVGKWDFIFNGADSKASSITESSEVYLFIDIKYVDVTIKEST